MTGPRTFSPPPVPAPDRVPARRRTRGPIRAAILAGIAAPCASQAQVIDQYLNVAIPGYGAEAGVTVASRAHPEYEPQGVRLGSFLITPILSESVGYDDNVTGTSKPRGSPLIETNASVNAAGGDSSTTIVSAISMDDVEYPQQSPLSYTNWQAALGVSHDFGQDMLNIGATHLNLNQTPGNLNVPGISEAIAYRVEDARATYTLDLGHFSLEPGLDVSYYDFDNGSVGSVDYLQTYRNRIVLQPSVIANYAFATRRQLVLVLRDTQSDFDRSPPGLPRQNFNDISALAGIAYDADGIIGFRLLGGYEGRSFTSSRYQNTSAPIVEAAATWTPSGLTTVTASAARYIEDSAAESTVGFTETALRLNVDHEYLRNVVFSLHGAVFLDSYPRQSDGSGGGGQDFFTGGVSASWRLNRNVRLGADYTYSTRHNLGGSSPPVSNTTAVMDLLQSGEVFGSNYSDDMFRLTLRLAL